MHAKDQTVTSAVTSRTVQVRRGVPFIEQDSSDLDTSEKAPFAIFEPLHVMK